MNSNVVHDVPAGRERLIIFGLAFVAVSLLNWPHWNQLPAWDAAMSVHPAAITLSKSGFDFGGLLRSPVYLQGGPNTHSLSVVTWLTAVAYWALAGSRALFPSLHFVHFAIAAFAMTEVYRFARPVIGHRLGLLVLAATLLYPAVIVQSGELYLEMPLLACTLLALTAWSERRVMTAAAWTLLAFYVKETGIIVAATLAAAAVIEQGPWSVRVRRAATVFLPVVAAYVLNAALVHPSEPQIHHPLPYLQYLRWLPERIRQVPDLCAAMGLFLLVTVIRHKVLWRSLRGGDETNAAETEPAVASRRLGLAHLLILAFGGFFLVANFVTEVFLLPRYFLQIIPCLFLGLVHALRVTMSPRVALATTALFAALFAVNRHGFFYPRAVSNDGAIAERSTEFNDLIEMQRQAVRALESVPAEIPVFYGYPEHFLVSYPEMGYSSKPLPNGHCIFLEQPYNRARLNDFPPHLCLLLDYPALGGELIYAVLAQAKRNGWTISPIASASGCGDYRMVLIELTAPQSVAAAE